MATVLDDDASRARVHAALLTEHGAALRVVDAPSVLAGLRARALRRPGRERVRSPRAAGTVASWLTT